MRSKEKRDGNSDLFDTRKILAIIQKNWIVMTRDKTRLIPLIMMPIIMITVFGYGSGNAPKHISAGIIDYDNSAISEQILQEIAGSQTFSLRHMVSTEGEARRLLDAGKINVIIEIPPNLQEDLEKGLSPGLIVIVDESDASVGSTSKQAMRLIVERISHRIAVEKVASYQRSVGQAGEALLQAAASQPNLYGEIAQRTEDAQASLVASRQATDAYASYLESTLTQPTLIVVSDQDENMSTNNTYTFESASATNTKAIIAVMQASSRYASSAERDIVYAKALAENQDREISKRLEYENQLKNIQEPAKEIQVFVYSDAKGMVNPLVYVEKPAYGTGKRAVDFLIPAIIALTIFQGAIMGMGRSVAGEKRDGSLTRVFLTPTSNTTIITGTLGFYVIFEIIRAAFIIAVSMVLFNIQIEGSLLLIGLVLAVYAAISTSIGMMLSSMVKTEQQFMAMAMLVSMPTIFLSGAFFPVQAMPKFMQVIAQFLPVTYAGDALRSVMIKGFSFGMILFPFAILLAFLAGSLILVFMVFKRDIE